MPFFLEKNHNESTICTIGSQKEFFMKFLKLVTALLLLASIVSCSMTAPLAVTSNPIGRRTGEATGTFIFGVIPLGNPNMGIHKAALNGGITTISTVDIRHTNLLFLHTVTTVVTGD